MMPAEYALPIKSRHRSQNSNITLGDSMFFTAKILCKFLYICDFIRVSLGSQISLPVSIARK